MGTLSMNERIRILAIRKGYGGPGGHSRLAAELGWTGVKLSKILNGHFKNEEFVNRCQIELYDYLQRQNGDGKHAKQG